MNSIERVVTALDHRESDRVPVDQGSFSDSSINVVTVYQLRQALRLDPPGTPVKIVEPYQMLGEVKPDLMDALGVDVVGLTGIKTMFGFDNDGWKPWTLPDGTPVLVPSGFNTDPEETGEVLMYPEGDKSAPPSALMPQGGYYFDAIPREVPFDEDDLQVEDNLEEFGPISAVELEHFRMGAERLQRDTDKAILLHGIGGLALGDVGNVPAPWLKHPRGVRDVASWYTIMKTRPDFVYRIFERQTEISLVNLEKIAGVVGNRITAVQVSGTDFGMQTGPLISPRTYRELFKPFHLQINQWIHANMSWKTLIHTCGSVWAFLPDFIEAGFDILNPVQCSAARMNPAELKQEYGRLIVFWGGGVDTQSTLPFGTPEQVRQQVIERIRALAPGGGFVFNTIHNIQPLVPVENILEMFSAVREYGSYPI